MGAEGRPALSSPGTPDHRASRRRAGPAGPDTPGRRILDARRRSLPDAHLALSRLLLPPLSRAKHLRCLRRVRCPDRRGAQRGGGLEGLRQSGPSGRERGETPTLVADGSSGTSGAADPEKGGEGQGGSGERVGQVLHREMVGGVASRPTGGDHGEIADTPIHPLRGGAPRRAGPAARSAGAGRGDPLQALHPLPACRTPLRAVLRGSARLGRDRNRSTFERYLGDVQRSRATARRDRRRDPELIRAHVARRVAHLGIG
jgi:hypothetical protein